MLAIGIAEIKKVEILKKINIDFEKGTFYTITGPSGAGKSTFLALAGALDSPKEGAILYEGKDLKKSAIPNFAINTSQSSFNHTTCFLI